MTCTVCWALNAARGDARAQVLMRKCEVTRPCVVWSWVWCVNRVWSAARLEWMLNDRLRIEIAAGFGVVGVYQERCYAARETEE